MKRHLAYLGCLLLLAAMPAAKAADTWTVTATGSGGTCTANSTTDANCTLDVATSGAAAGDIVHFAASVQGATFPGSDINILPAGLTIDASPNGVVIDAGGSTGIFIFDSGTFVLSHLTLQNSHGFGNEGGAITNTGADVTVDTCTIQNNLSPSPGFGGGIYNSNGTMTVVNSTITGNVAQGSGSGGGIYNNVGTGTLIVINSTVAGNSAGYGGGIFDQGAQLVVANSTITGNSASSGGGIWSEKLVLSSSIVAGNSASSGPDVYDSYDEGVSLGYNVIGDSTQSNLAGATGDQFDVDPLFFATGLANNGGLTQTVALQAASPARSGGNCAGNASNPTIPAVTLDQRGYKRSTPCTAGALDMTSTFANGFE